MDDGLGLSLPRRRFLAAHEVVLIALGICTTFALLTVGNRSTPVIIEVLAVSALFLSVILPYRHRTDIFSQRVRLLASFAFVLWYYCAIARIVPALGVSLRDSMLLSFDESLFGHTPAIFCERIATPRLTDLMSLCYVIYHLYLFLAVFHAALLANAASRRLAAYLFTGFAFGFIGYLLVPAIGPAAAYPQLFTTPLHGGLISRLVSEVVEKGTSAYDCFPSLHVMITCVLLDHDWREFRPRFWIMLLPSIGLMISTVYLRYHYGVDVLAAFLLFLPLRKTFLIAWRRQIECPNATMELTLAPWVREIARRPIAFAQVREDAVLDQEVVNQLRDGAEVMMIASGGCTAAALAATTTVSRLHLVDANPSQIAIARLKLRLLDTANPSERCSILGHSPMPFAERRLRLACELQALDLPVDALGPIDLVSQLGPDFAGRYEALFAKLQDSLRDVTDGLDALLQLRDPAAQSRWADSSTPLGLALDTAFDSVMSLPNLVGLFGEAATRNRCEPFSRHFARRTRHALATLPANDNPYLWQLLRGQFPTVAKYSWLNAAAPARMPVIQWTVGGMSEALQAHQEAFDFVHLSNILDWLTPDEARHTLDLACKALRPGGLTLIRQLNSSLDIRALGTQFEWQDHTASRLHKRDRSFFYRALHLGRKK